MNCHVRLTLISLWIITSCSLATTVVLIVINTSLPEHRLVQLDAEPYSPVRGFDKSIGSIWGPLAKSAPLTEENRLYKTLKPDVRIPGASIPSLTSQSGNGHDNIAFFETPIPQSISLAESIISAAPEESIIITSSLIPLGKSWTWRLQAVTYSNSGVNIATRWSLTFVLCAAAILISLTASLYYILSRCYKRRRQ